MAIQRFRVRSDSKAWTDPGPDLLRKPDNARRQVKTLMGDRLKGWSFRTVNAKGVKSPESKVMGKVDVRDRMDSWMRNPTDMFVLLHHGEAAVVVKSERVAIVETASCSPSTVELRSLFEHQFPKARYAGGYVWKEILGSNPAQYSDHAWGTAIDESENLAQGYHNDEGIDWLSRMAKSGNIDFDYALGSRGGRVVSCGAPDFDIEPSGAADSHKWHTHISIVDHDGRKPPRPGGVW